MKLTSKSNKATPQTLIAEGCFIEGQLKLTSNIHIDGKVKGNIETGGTVIISATGAVEGSIRAERLIVNGRFKGQIYANCFAILEKGHVEGDACASEFTIEKGGVFLGHSKHITVNQPTTHDEVVELKTTKDAQKPKKTAPVTKAS